jgi:hypothetical protein
MTARHARSERRAQTHTKGSRRAPAARQSKVGSGDRDDARGDALIPDIEDVQQDVRRDTLMNSDRFVKTEIERVRR